MFCFSKRTFLCQCLRNCFLYKTYTEQLGHEKAFARALNLVSFFFFFLLESIAL